MHGFVSNLLVASLVNSLIYISQRRVRQSQEWQLPLATQALLCLGILQLPLYFNVSSLLLKWAIVSPILYWMINSVGLQKGDPKSTSKFLISARLLVAQELSIISLLCFPFWVGNHEVSLGLLFSLFLWHKLELMLLLAPGLFTCLSSPEFLVTAIYGLGNTALHVICLLAALNPPGFQETSQLGDVVFQVMTSVVSLGLGIVALYRSLPRLNDNANTMGRKSSSSEGYSTVTGTPDVCTFLRVDMPGTAHSSLPAGIGKSYRDIEVSASLSLAHAEVQVDGELTSIISKACDASADGHDALGNCFSGHATSNMFEAAEDNSWQTVVEALREHSGDIAHDMKNPLNGILALSQNVIAGTFGELPRAAADQLGVVRSCAYHLLNMVNNLRDMMKMLNGGSLELNISKVNLSNPVEEVLERMSPMVGNRLTVNFSNSSLHAVVADDQRLYQVVHIILANAFKYTRRGHVDIHSSTTEEGKYLIFSVKDTGTGFTPAQLKKFNSPLTGSIEEQLGLGLTMVRHLVYSFGGCIDIANRKEGGCEVKVTFKVDRAVPDLTPMSTIVVPKSKKRLAREAAAAAAAEAAAADLAMEPSSVSSEVSLTAGGSIAPIVPATGPLLPPALGSPTPPLPLLTVTPGAPAPLVPGGNAPNSNKIRHSLHRERAQSVAHMDKAAHAYMRASMSNEGCNTEAARILIVDDDPVNVTILEDLLKGVGYQTMCAFCGTEALEMYATCDPPVNLVLLDVLLPDMTGHEVCLKMRSLTPGVPPPIIMISGKASTNDVIRGLQAGSNDYITKPFQPQEVLARVENQLRLYMGELQELQEAAERNMRLLSQVLPHHILHSLHHGKRILVEKFPDVVMLQADVIGFHSLAAHADTSDCILSLNRIFSLFDTLTDKHGVHKIDCTSEVYTAAVGHVQEDASLSTEAQVWKMLDLARAMLSAVAELPPPVNMGKMEIRIGLHVGMTYAGVLGIKYPRYGMIGTSVRLTGALLTSALPMTIHMSEMVASRLRDTSAATADWLLPYTRANFAGLGIITTYLTGPKQLKAADLAHVNVIEYIRNANTGSGLQVLTPLVGQPVSQAAPFSMPNTLATFSYPGPMQSGSLPPASSAGPTPTSLSASSSLPATFGHHHYSTGNTASKLSSTLAFEEVTADMTSEEQPASAALSELKPSSPKCISSRQPALSDMDWYHEAPRMYAAAAQAPESPNSFTGSQEMNLAAPALLGKVLPPVLDYPEASHVSPHSRTFPSVQLDACAGSLQRDNALSEVNVMKNLATRIQERMKTRADNLALSSPRSLSPVAGQSSQSPTSIRNRSYSSLMGAFQQSSSPVQEAADAQAHASRGLKSLGMASVSSSAASPAEDTRFSMFNTPPHKITRGQGWGSMPYSSRPSSSFACLQPDDSEMCRRASDGLDVVFAKLDCNGTAQAKAGKPLRHAVSSLTDIHQRPASTRLTQAERQQSKLQAATHQESRPTHVADLLQRLGMSYYTKALEASKIALVDQLEGLDDEGLRKVGLITARAREAVLNALAELRDGTGPSTTQAVTRR